MFSAPVTVSPSDVTSSFILSIQDSLGLSLCLFPSNLACSALFGIRSTDILSTCPNYPLLDWLLLLLLLLLLSLMLQQEQEHASRNWSRCGQSDWSLCEDWKQKIRICVVTCYKVEKLLIWCHFNYNSFHPGDSFRSNGWYRPKWTILY